MTQNVRAWVLWIAAASLLTMVARNPLYTLILLLVSRLVMFAFADPDAPLQLPLWRLSVTVFIISAVYNALFVHIGNTVLFEMPDWPLVGGPITMEALVGGLANGLILVTLLSVFSTLNAVVPVGELVRLTPASMQDLGIVVLIALTYIPETLGQLKRIREAQAIRGHELRTVGDWRPVVVPLLIGGLERSMRLAETMVARGLGSTESRGSTLGERLALTLGLLAALGGWLLALWRGWPGWVLLSIGVLVLGGLLWYRGRALQRTSYRVRKWMPTDTLLVISAGLALAVVLLPWPFIDASSLTYIPFPQLKLPPFDGLIGLALAGLAIPALKVAWRKSA